MDGNTWQCLCFCDFAIILKALLALAQGCEFERLPGQAFKISGWNVLDVKTAGSGWDEGELEITHPPYRHTTLNIFRFPWEPNEPSLRLGAAHRPPALNLCFCTGQRPGLWGQHWPDLKSGSASYPATGLRQVTSTPCPITQGIARTPPRGKGSSRDQEDAQARICWTLNPWVTNRTRDGERTTLLDSFICT